MSEAKIIMSNHSAKVVRQWCYGIPVPFTAKKLSGNEVRVPDPVPGEAAVISRYGKERAIVLHPADFNRLNELEQLIARRFAIGSVGTTHVLK